MSSPTSGSDPHYPQEGWSQGQPGWGAPQQPGGGAASSTMNLPDAVRSVLTQYAVFTGRARRSEYWWFALAYVIAYVVAAVVDAVIGFPILTLAVALGLLVPSIAVSVRRLHDTDRSGWWLLLNLVPLGGIVVLVFSCLDSQPGRNRYGPSPKHPAPVGF